MQAPKPSFSKFFFPALLARFPCKITSIFSGSDSKTTLLNPSTSSSKIETSSKDLQVSNDNEGNFSFKRGDSLKFRSIKTTWGPYIAPTQAEIDGSRFINCQPSTTKPRLNPRKLARKPSLQVLLPSKLSLVRT